MTFDHNLFDQAVRHFLEEYSHSGSIETLHQIKPNNIDTQLILNCYAELKAAEPLRLLREQRNRLLAETDWRMASDYPGSNQTEWQTYRQALRDITTQSPSLDSDGNLTGITWPTPPND